LVAALARGEEAVVALHPAAVPSVIRIWMAAASPGIAEGPAEQWIGRHRGPVGTGVRLVGARLHPEPRSPAQPALVEVRLVGAEPAEIVVEGTILHNEDDHGVDRRIGGGQIEDAAAPQPPRFGLPGGGAEYRTCAERRG